MNVEAFTIRWFTIYYLVLAFISIGTGFYLIIKNKDTTDYLLQKTTYENPPRLLIRLLKYFFLFTLPGLILSFTPFSWIELLFSIWSLLLVYTVGIQLVRWHKNRIIIKTYSAQLPEIISRCGAIMVAVGFSLFLLAYLVIKRSSI